MPSIKEYNDKLYSLRNTSKMTRTMKMVSASKLRRAQEAQRQAVEYDRRLKAFIGRLAASVDTASHPLLQPRPEVHDVLLLVYTSDRGLCGGFNNGIIRRVMGWMDENRHRYRRIALSFCGRRGYGHFREREETEAYYEGITAAPSMAGAVEIGEDVTRQFTQGAYDAVFLAYNVFQSPLSQTPALHQLLPFESTSFLEGGEPIPQDYLFEPSQQEQLNRLLPRILYFEVYFALLENAAGEHGARMTAMDSATTNAMNLIERYTLLRNRARQAAITTELIEIVAGAEAL